MAKATFLKPFTRERHQQEFDRKKIFFIQKGKKINVYDLIQENREDTEILPTLRKYGNLKPLELDAPAMYGQFKEMMRLEDVYEIKRKADEMWDEIPAEIKEQFNNSQEEFLKGAEKWLDEKIKTIQAQPTENNEPKKGESNQ